VTEITGMGAPIAADMAWLRSGAIRPDRHADEKLSTPTGCLMVVGRRVGLVGCIEEGWWWDLHRR
jgi:hypothetical protein